jgi:hypothetical protein
MDTQHTPRTRPPHDPPGGDTPDVGPPAPRPLWAEKFQRRLRLALGDLRLPLPADWLVVGDDGTVTFKDLGRLPADRLVLALEAAVDAAPGLRRTAQPGEGQMELIFGFVDVPATHLEVA